MTQEDKELLLQDLCARPIAQYSKDGIFIQSWGCIMDAKNALNINYSTIWRCLQGYRKLGKGYIWKYL